jgi:hypothetical protein
MRRKEELLLAVLCLLPIASASGIEVDVASAGIKRVILANGRYSTEPVLVIRLRIENTSETQSVHYGGWAFRKGDRTFLFRGSLSDQAGNSYRPVLFAAIKAAGQLEEHILKPGTAV